MLIFRGSFVFFSFFFGFRRRRRRRQPPTLLFGFVFFVSPFGISLGKRRVGFRFLFSAPLVRPLPSELGKKLKKKLGNIKSGPVGESDSMSATSFTEFYRVFLVESIQESTRNGWKLETR